MGNQIFSNEIDTIENLNKYEYKMNQMENKNSSHMINKNISEVKLPSNKNSLSNLKDNESTKDESEINKILSEDCQENIFQTIFEWKESGNNIYMSGTFCNWNSKFLLHKIGNNHELIIVRH